LVNNFLSTVRASKCTIMILLGYLLFYSGQVISTTFAEVIMVSC